MIKLALHFLFVYLFIYKLKFDYFSPTISFDLIILIGLIIFILVVRRMDDIKDALPRFSWKYFYDMKDYFNLTYGNILLVLLDVWGIGLSSLLAGSMSSELLAVKTSLNSVYTIFYSFC